MKNDLDYTILNDRPYDNELNRSPSPMDNGSVEDKPVKSEGALGDVWIDSFIKSTNYSPKKTGFYIDGLTGYAEFSNAYIVGKIYASIGEIGGFIIGPDYIRDINNSFGLSSQSDILNIYGEDVRFWAGTTFENRENAPFLIRANGEGVLSGFVLENENGGPLHQDRIYSIKDPGFPKIEINATNEFISVGRTDSNSIIISGQDGNIYLNDDTGTNVGIFGTDTIPWGLGTKKTLGISIRDALMIRNFNNEILYTIADNGPIYGEPRNSTTISPDLYINSIFTMPGEYLDGLGTVIRTGQLGSDGDPWYEVYGRELYYANDLYVAKQPWFFSGTVDAAGNLDSVNINYIKTSAANMITTSNIAPGVYRINHKFNFIHYQVLCAPLDGHYRYRILNQTADYVDISWQETNYITDTFSVSGGGGGSVSVGQVRDSSDPEIPVTTAFHFLLIQTYPNYP